MEMETPYFYYISVVKQQIGPVDQEELFEAFASGDLSKDGFVWGGKITDWTKINESYLWSDLKTKFSHLFKAASSSNSHRRLKSFHSRKKSITSTRISASGIGGWAEFLNPDGIPYYYNELTGQTSWDKPKELQAKNELERAGKWIWIPDHLDGFVPAKLLGDLYGGAKEVQLEDGSRKVIDKKTKTYSLNWASLKRNYSDLVLLDELSEPLILHNLRKRFSLDEIYTNIGTILISINPFKPLPLYTPDMMSKYRNRGQKDLPPHVFIIADNSFEKMMETNCSQSIIISGKKDFLYLNSNLSDC